MCRPTPSIRCRCVRVSGAVDLLTHDLAHCRSHWGRLRVTGRDRLSFLHGQSTAKLAELQPGQQTDTVFTTAQVLWTPLLQALHMLTCRQHSVVLRLSRLYALVCLVGLLTVLHYAVQGRTLDLATCLVSGSGVLLIVSPTQTAPLAQRLQKFILFGDEVPRCVALRLPWSKWSQYSRSSILHPRLHCACAAFNSC